MVGPVKCGVLVAHRRRPVLDSRTVRENCLARLKEGYCGLRRTILWARPDALIGEGACLTEQDDPQWDAEGKLADAGIRKTLTIRTIPTWCELGPTIFLSFETAS